MTRGPDAAIGAARLQAESDLCLLLSRAFLPPRWEGAHAAMAGLLADDLTACAAALPLDIGDDIRLFRSAMAGLADDRALVSLYSRMHLAPPVLAPLNAGLYLDGALQGASVLAMEACYRRHGVQRAPDFKDLADHLSVQLEFVGHLLAAAAGANGAAASSLRDEAAAFAEAFLGPWIPTLAERVERAAAARSMATPYRPLLDILMKTMGVTIDESRAPLQATTTGRRAD